MILDNIDETKYIKAGIRWQVFERDDFKCVACGRSAQDVAILHVDHHIDPFTKQAVLRIGTTPPGLNSNDAGEVVRCYGPDIIIASDNGSEFINKDTIDCGI